MSEKPIQSLEAYDTSSLSLEERRIEDIGALITESQHAFLPSVKRPDETIETLLNKFQTDQNFALFGYEINGKPATYVTALSYQDKDTIAIGPMYVAEIFRGHGLGKKQVVDFIDIYQAKGCHSIFTKTWSSNDASRSTFQQLGFKIVGVNKQARVNGDATISYQLDI